MFSIDLTLGALIYTFSAFVIILSLSLFYDLRDRKLYEGERRKAIFHCIRCDKLYSAKQGEDVCECPRCHFKNSRLKF